MNIKVLLSINRNYTFSKKESISVLMLENKKTAPSEAILLT